MIGVPFDVVGGTGGHKSIQFSSEVSRNVYIDFSDTASRKGQHDFPGLKSFVSQSGADRGFHEMAGILYKISGNTLYSVSRTGLEVALASIPGSERAIFANDGVNLAFCTEGVLYYWNGSLHIVSITVVSNPSAIAYINKQFIVCGDGGLFAISDPGSITSWNALNYAEEETLPDVLYRPYVFSQLIYMMGGKSVVPWADTGQGNPPLARQDTSLVNIGICGKHAAINTDQFLYWLSDDKKLYQCVGASARNVTTPGASYILDGIADVSGCILSEFTHKGQQFILLSFPGRTLFFSETYSYWGELSAGTDITPAQWYGNSIINVYGKNYVSDYRNGNLYELDPDTYTDNGDTRLRIRDFPVFTSALLGRPGRRITVSGIKFDMQVGVGLASGQGSQPVLMCQLSNDGGHTWGEEINVDIGAMGEYTEPAYAWGFSNGYNIRLRLKCSDPVFLSLFGGMVYLREAGY